MLKITTIEDLERMASDGSIGTRITITMRNKNIDDAIAARIADALMRAHSLIDTLNINLAHNQISDPGAQALAQTLGYMINQGKLNQLTLNLDESQITCSGATALAAALQSTKVRRLYLHLAGNEIGHDGAMAVLGIMASEAAPISLDLSLASNPFELTDPELIATFSPTITREKVILNLSDTNDLDGNLVASAMYHMVRNSQPPRELSIALPPSIDDDGARTLHDMLSLHAAAKVSFGLLFEFSEITGDSVALFAHHLSSDAAAKNLKQLSLIGCVLTPETLSNLLGALRAGQTPTPFGLTIKQLFTDEPGQPSEDEVTSAQTAAITAMLESGHTPQKLTLSIGEDDFDRENWPVITAEQGRQITRSLNTAIQSGQSPHQFRLFVGPGPVAQSVAANDGYRWDIEWKHGVKWHAGYAKGPVKRHPRPTLCIPSEPMPGLFGSRHALADFERLQLMTLILCNYRSGFGKKNGIPPMPFEMWLMVALSLDAIYYREGFTPHEPVAAALAI